MLSVPRKLFAISVATLRSAEAQVLSCESCDHKANTLFQRVLDRLAHRGRDTTDYVHTRMPRCPRCSKRLFDDTLVEVGVDWYLQ